MFVVVLIVRPQSYWKHPYKPNYTYVKHPNKAFCKYLNINSLIYLLDYKT